jgi:hypothetical protein
MALMFGVLIPVGPDPREVSRLDLLLGELGRHENPREISLIVVDDASEPRELAASWSGRIIVRTPRPKGKPPDAPGAPVAGTLEGLRAGRELDFVLKLDTDAAVIQPCSDQIADAFRDSSLGMVGSYDTTWDGGVRNFSMWKRTLDRASLPITVGRDNGRLQIWRHGRRERAAVRRLRKAAYRFAPPGAHCLGGAYAVSRSFLESAELDFRPWSGARLGEDVVVGLLCSAAGLRMASLTGPGQPFALSWKGLPGSPAAIAESGASLVHSVKCDEPHRELALREQLRTLALGAKRSGV